MAASPVDDVLDEEKIPKALGIFDWFVQLHFIWPTSRFIDVFSVP
jgi:hypothetical protein